MNKKNNEGTFFYDALALLAISVIAVPGVIVALSGAVYIREAVYGEDVPLPTEGFVDFGDFALTIGSTSLLLIPLFLAAYVGNKISPGVIERIPSRD